MPTPITAARRAIPGVIAIITLLAVLTLAGLAVLTTLAAPAPGPTNASPANASPSPTPSPSPSPRSSPRSSPSPIRFGLVTVDPSARTVSLPARINQTNGILEYVLVTDYGKTHESLLITEVAARDLQSGLLLLNAVPAGTNAVAAAVGPPPPASAVSLHLRWPIPSPTNRIAIDRCIALASHDPDAPANPGGIAPKITGPLPPGPWLFNGSTFSAEGFVAHFEGSLIALIRDPGAIINNPRPDRDDDDTHVPAPASFPPYGTPVLLEVTVPRRPH